MKCAPACCPPPPGAAWPLLLTAPALPPPLQAPTPSHGLAAALFGAAASAVHAVQVSPHLRPTCFADSLVDHPYTAPVLGRCCLALQEQVQSILEHGRQLAQEQDSSAADMAAGGGSIEDLAEQGGEEAHEAEAEPQQPPSPRPPVASAAEQEAAQAAAADVQRGALLVARTEEETPALPGRTGGEAELAAAEGPAAAEEAAAAEGPVAAEEAAFGARFDVREEPPVAAPSPAPGAAGQAGSAVLPPSPHRSQQTMKVGWLAQPGGFLWQAREREERAAPSAISPPGAAANIAAPHHLQEAVEEEPAVSASLLQALEGAEEPGTLSPAAEPPTSTSAGAAAPGQVLPVVATAADQRTEAEAAVSPRAAASLATEQEVPDAGAAQLAAAELAQPESLDTTAQFLSEREAARRREGLGVQPPCCLEHPEEEPAERLQLKVN